MPEEQDMQAKSHEAPAETPTGGTPKLKAVIWVVVGVIILAAAFAYARQMGNNSEEGVWTGEESAGFGDATFGESAFGGESQELEPPVGTVIDNGAGFAVDAPEGQAKEFDVTAKNFEFSMKEIRVKKGDTVRVNFTSAGGTHNWMVHEFDALTETVNQGGTSAVVFVADKAGEFEYHCMVGSHRSLGMVGKLIVEE